jgi:dipeptidyl-peptidase-4
MNREVYATDRKGKTTCLTTKDGWNSAVFSKDFSHFILTWSDANTPYQYSIYNNKGKEVVKLMGNEELQQKVSALGVPQKEFFKFKTSEGVDLNGVMIRPANFDASKKYPVIMWQYSGPGSQQVINSWRLGSMGNGALYDHYLAQEGFIVVCVDGRGTGGRGADFEKQNYRKLGWKESRDQVETALYLGSLPYVDKNRIGIWGWSYGGFNTLMSMSEGRGVFRAGIAIAPPTSWRYYDTVYTERFMRTPQENPTGYDDCPIARADKLHGALLLCHGMADDNVHFRNTAEYTEALVQADKDFRQLVYTNRNHSIYGGNTRNHLFRQCCEFFEKELKN